MIKINSGLLKGFSLAPPAVEGLRPTSSRIREAVLNRFIHRANLGAFLDLFAGSGAVGFEAVSRGASSVVFVESDPQVFKALNISIQKAKDRLSNSPDTTPIIKCITSPSLKALKQFIKSKIKYDIIYADPPFATSLECFSELADFLAECLDSNGLLAWECPTSVCDKIIEHAAAQTSLTLEDHKSYKDKHILYFSVPNQILVNQ